jgi:hypothetical protein
MENDLKISKMEYLRNHLLDHFQISNIILDDQTIFYKSSNKEKPPKGRQHQNIKSGISQQSLYGFLLN